MPKYPQFLRKHLARIFLQFRQYDKTHIEVLFSLQDLSRQILKFFDMKGMCHMIPKKFICHDHMALHSQLQLPQCQDLCGERVEYFSYSSRSQLPSDSN